MGDGPEDFLAAVHATREWPDAATLLRLIDVPGGTRYEPLGHWSPPATRAA